MGRTGEAAGWYLEQTPEVNLECQGKKPTKKHKSPKQHTPFCLGHRTGALESGLSAAAELRERKGGWLVSSWSLAAVSRVPAMALCDGVNNCETDLLGMPGRGDSPALTPHPDGETE